MSHKLKVLIVGVSGGAGYVYERDCSSSFIILKNEQPLCLVDLGLGVTAKLHELGYEIPPNVIITHNHTDHSGELPVVARVEHAKGRPLKILSEPQVAERLKHHRLAEHLELFSADELVDWVSADEGRFFLDEEYFITFHATQHSELCFGFVLSQLTPSGAKAVLGYTADSGAFAPLYAQMESCSVAIFDARPKGNAWHAGFDEVAPYMGDGRYILGHGVTEFDKYPQLPLLKSGQMITITE